jgi:transcriptional regulator with XRE-family HTH domain
VAELDQLTPGQRVQMIRNTRGLSLRAVAELAGISAGYLSRIEHGERALDSRKLIVALANALQVAPTELTQLAAALPDENDRDSALNAVRRAFFAVDMGTPVGEAQPVELLEARVLRLITSTNDADVIAVGAELPGLIGDLHATLAAHRDERAVLRLVTLAHMQVTQAWLAAVGAPVDLVWKAATAAREAAQRLDEPMSLGIAAFGTGLALLAAGAFDMAARTVAEVDLPTTTVEEQQLSGMVALASSLVSAARDDVSQRVAALEHAAELAERTGETNIAGFGFGPSNVAVWRMQVALEAGDYADAARIATTVEPEALTVRARRAVYWREQGRALARLPRHRDEAVAALRRAELISPESVHRHPLTRSVLAELVGRAKRDAVGRELRGIAYRAGLPV